MEKNNLIKFDQVELELLNSESELSEIRGGKGSIGAIIDAIIEFFDNDEPTNGNCNGCTNHCN